MVFHPLCPVCFFTVGPGRTPSKRLWDGQWAPSKRPWDGQPARPWDGQPALGRPSLPLSLCHHHTPSTHPTLRPVQFPAVFDDR
jgi:hypothetical protein